MRLIHVPCCPFLNRAVRPVWQWLTLLVVLLSAVPSGALPGMRAVGSAFDPAAASVAIGPKHRLAGLPELAARKCGLPETGAGSGVLCPAAVAQTGARSACGPAADRVVPAQQARRHQLCRTLYAPRAPPFGSLQNA